MDTAVLHERAERMRISIRNTPPAIYGASGVDSLPSPIRAIRLFCSWRHLAEYCRDLRQPYFVPLRERRAVDACGAKRRVFSPLFPGYAFLGGLSAYADLRRRIGFEPLDADEYRLRRELLAVEAAIQSNPAMIMQNIPAGSRVRIVRGPFQGMDAIVEQDRGYRVMCIMRTMGQVFEIDVDMSDIELLDQTYDAA